MADQPTINPYAPPRADAELPPAGVAGTAFPDPLFSPRQALAGAILGSILAGVIMLQANYRVMGETKAANKSLVLGLLSTFALLALMVVLPKNIPSTPINIVAALTFYKLFDSLQGQAFVHHRAAGGDRRSNWVVAAIILGAAAAIFVVAFLILFSSGGFDSLE